MLFYPSQNKLLIFQHIYIFNNIIKYMSYPTAPEFHFLRYDEPHISGLHTRILTS